MSDRLQFELGHEPWEPSEDSRLVAVFREYDRPLLGILQHEGNRYLFECLQGEMERTSHWLYTLLEPGELERLDSLAGRPFDKAMAVIQTSRPSQLAIAVEGAGVVVDIFVPDLRQLRECAADLGRRYEQHLRFLNASLEEVEDRSASTNWERIASPA